MQALREPQAISDLPSLLLLPGMTCDAAFWRAQVEGLSDLARPLVADYGAADSFEAMAEAVLMAAPRRFALAGHSMGGRVAQEIYRRAPERVDRLALMATEFRGVADLAAETDRRNGMLAAVAAGGMEAFAGGWVRQVVAEANLADRALVDAVVAMMVRQGPERLAAQTHAALTRQDRAGLLPEISCPTLVLAGEEDRLRPVEVHRQMAAAIPRASLAVVEGAAHMVAMERPEAVTAAMRAWLTA